MMREEGLDERVRAPRRAWRARRAPAREALGLKLVAPDAPSPATTGVFAPDGVDTGKLVRLPARQVGVTFAGGQDQLQGQDLPHRAPRLHRHASTS